MASMDTQSNQLDLLLVQSAGEHLQGMVRLDGTLYPALATPTTDNSQLVINAITDDGPRFVGYGQAVNFEPDGTTRAAPQLMTFHLKGREEDTPLPARLYTPENRQIPCSSASVLNRHGNNGMTPESRRADRKSASSGTLPQPRPLSR